MRFQHSRLTGKFFLMVAITLPLLIFLFTSSNSGFLKITENTSGTAVLHNVNQILLEAIIEEKIFLKDHSDKSLQAALAMVRQAIQEADALKNYPLFSTSDIHHLTGQLKAYEHALIQLSREIIALDAKDHQLVEFTDRFNLKTIEIIGLVNAYDSLCQLEDKKPNIHMLKLRDVARDAVIATTRVFSVLR